MKKLTSIVLVAILVLSCFTVTAFAQTSNGKLTDALLQKIEKLSDDDAVKVCIWARYDSNELIEKAKQKASEKVGAFPNGPYKDEKEKQKAELDWVQEYTIAYNKYMQEYESDLLGVMINDANIKDESIIEYAGPMLICNTKKSDIYLYANSNFVDFIDYYDEDIQVVEPTDESKDLFKDLFAEKIGVPVSELPYYNEKYYHYSNDTGDMDWILIRANSNMVYPWVVYESLGNIVLRDYNEGIPFSFGYCVLDVSKLDFVSLEKAYNDCSMYDGLEQIVDEMVGERIGDVDKDGVLSVIDATTIQKCLANLMEFPQDDTVDHAYYRLRGETVYYISDYNRDGIRDIMDATAIQQYLASVE